MQPHIGLEKEVLKKDNAILNDFLSDLHVLYIKTRKYHWNVSGPNFMEYHKFFEKQYNALETEIDAVAERIRQLGGTPLATMGEFLKNTSLKEDTGKPAGTPEMFKNLLSDHEQVVRELREDVDTCTDDLKDAGTADFLTGLMEAHEAMAWMLRKYLS